MLILATDMARHSEIVERFKSKLDTFDFHNDDYVSSVSRQMKRIVLSSVCHEQGTRKNSDNPAAVKNRYLYKIKI